MEIKTRKTVIIPELRHLISRKGGGTWSNLYNLFYYTRLFKYVHKDQYKNINSMMFKISAGYKLKELCDRGYLFSPREDVYCAKDKILPILKEVGNEKYVVNTLPEEPKGKGDINELNNTEVLIKIFREKTKEETFLTFLYPNFGYLIPDALLVELDKENKKYKLTFIEVEAKKPDWENVLENKRINYLKLSKDISFYHKWQTYCEQLGFSKPDISKLKFNYKIIKYNL